MSNLKHSALAVTLAAVLAGCAPHAQKQKDFENALVNKFCSEEFFAQNEAKIQKNSDVIYTGINAGLIARGCSEYGRSNSFFDAAEESYKIDVDMENLAAKGARTVASTLVNDNVFDYGGTLYERIMVNTYKGLNYMSLNDFENARVEFNRALMRQDKAKEYFARQIEKNRAELDKSKKTAGEDGFNKSSDDIMGRYDDLFREFETTKDFVNPYATYMASVFFYMDRDYAKASDLLREVALINPKDAQLQKQYKLFEQRARAVTGKKAKNYIFVAYEDGFGTVKEEFRFTVPLPVDGKLITASFAMPTLKKREPSFGSIQVNKVSTSRVVDFDTVVATEFKLELPGVIAKAVASTITKTAINAVVAKNDSTGGLLALASSALTTLATQADTRSWRGLPKTASVVMLENNGKLDIHAANGEALLSQSVNKGKNVLVVVRSYAPYYPTQISVIER